MACEWRDGRWHLETSTGTVDEADVVIAATGVLHHPNVPRHPRPGGLRRGLLPQLPLGPRRPHRRRPGRSHRHGLDGHPDHRAAVVDRVGALHASSSGRRSGSCRWRTRRTTTRPARRCGRTPTGWPASTTSLSDAFEGFSHAVVEADSPAMAAIEQAVPRQPGGQRHRPRPPGAPPPRLPGGLQAPRSSPAGFYEAIQHPNAELVTSDIERVEPEGVRTADGVLHELDVLVLATGFHTDAFLRPTTVVGRDGVTLEEAWADRPVAYLSISIPDFPNLFLLNGPNGPVGNFSLIEVAELQLAYVLQLMEHLRDRRQGRGQRQPRGHRRLRGGPLRGVPQHDLGHGLSQLVPRRPGRPRRLAVALLALPRRDGRPRPRGLRPALSLRRFSPGSPRQVDR